MPLVQISLNVALEDAAKQQVAQQVSQLLKEVLQVGRSTRVALRRVGKQQGSCASLTNLPHGR